MTLTYDKNAAVVVLPALGGGRLQDPQLRSWLTRAELRRVDKRCELLESVLDALQLPCPGKGLAALRMWGQTGDRPTVWVAAAEPVYLEPRLDHLCLHALGFDQLPPADQRAVFDYLQDQLADGARFGFARIGRYGYVRSSTPMATARLSAHVIDQQRPNAFMPGGEGSADYRGLRSEIEMALHDHEINLQRQASGLPPINSLWLWGGGFAPEQRTQPHPPLYANEPLLRGYWLSNTAVVAPWPGSIAACLDASVAGFVAVPDLDPDDIGSLCACLRELRAALDARRLSRLRLLFGDGLEADVERGHAWRYWRRSRALLD